LLAISAIGVLVIPLSLAADNDLERSATTIVSG
jgi:hypothetical protein